MLPQTVIIIRTDICKKCPSTCSNQKSLSFLSDSCSECPLSYIEYNQKWGQFDCGSPKNESSPTIIQMGQNLTKSTVNWVKSGLPLVTKEIYKQRLKICKNCQYWLPNARLGMGKCNHSKCGCTKIKLKLATESCPIKLWERINSP